MTRLAVRIPDNMQEISAEFLQKLLLSPGSFQDGKDGDFIPVPADATLAEAQEILIDAALKRSGFNRKLAAAMLGLGERTLRRKLNEK